MNHDCTSSIISRTSESRWRIVRSWKSSLGSRRVTRNMSLRVELLRCYLRSEPFDLWPERVTAGREYYRRVTRISDVTGEIATGRVGRRATSRLSVPLSFHFHPCLRGEAIESVLRSSVPPTCNVVYRSRERFRAFRRSSTVPKSLFSQCRARNGALSLRQKSCFKDCKCISPTCASLAKSSKTMNIK